MVKLQSVSFSGSRHITPYSRGPAPNHTVIDQAFQPYDGVISGGLPQNVQLVYNDRSGAQDYIDVFRDGDPVTTCTRGKTGWPGFRKPTPYGDFIADAVMAAQEASGTKIFP